jgi:hypothetical protein
MPANADEDALEAAVDQKGGVAEPEEKQGEPNLAALLVAAVVLLLAASSREGP